MTGQAHPLESMTRKLNTRARLDESERVALLSLPYKIHTIEPARHIVREGDRPER